MDAETKKDIVKRLNITLADLYVIYTKARNYHWNVKGISFYSFHNFFQKIYEQLNEFVDDVAERIATLGERPASTLKEFLELARVKEDTSQVSDPKAQIKNLLQDYETLINNIRKDISAIGEKDPATGDLLTDMLRELEKTAWMIRASSE